MGRQSSRIYTKGKDHKDVYSNGYYFDAIYLGDKLWWKKLKEINISDVYDIICTNDKYYGIASVYSDSLHYYIAEIDQNEIHLLYDIPYSDKYIQYELLSYEPYIRYTDGDSFIIFGTYSNNKGTIRQTSCMLISVSNKEIVSDKPLINCVFGNYDTDITALYMSVGNESYYYSQTYIEENSERYHRIIKSSYEDDKPISYVNMRSNSGNKLYGIGNDIKNSGRNELYVPVINIESSIYAIGSYYGSYGIYKLSDTIEPSAVMDNSHDLIFDRFISDSTNRTFCTDGSYIYMLGTYTEESIKKLCIYEFDGNSLSIYATIPEDVITASYDAYSIQLFDSAIIMIKNIRNQESSSNDMYPMYIIYPDEVKTIELLPMKYVTNLQGIIISGSYIYIYVSIAGSYNGMSGKGMITVDLEELSVVDFVKIQVKGD